MNRSFFVTPVLALALLATTAFSLGSSPTNDEAAIAAVITQFYAAFNAHDADAHAAFYADGAELSWGDGDSATLTDRAAFTAMSRQWHTANSALRIAPGAPSIRLLGDDTATALVRSTATVGETAVGEASTLFVLQYTPTGWRIAAEHVAMLPPTEG